MDSFYHIFLFFLHFKYTHSGRHIKKNEMTKKEINFVFFSMFNNQTRVIFIHLLMYEMHSSENERQLYCSKWYWTQFNETVPTVFVDWDFIGVCILCICINIQDFRISSNNCLTQIPDTQNLCKFFSFQNEMKEKALPFVTIR